MVRRAFLRLMVPLVGRTFAVLWWRRSGRTEVRPVVWAMRAWFGSIARMYEPMARRLAGGSYDGALVSAICALQEFGALRGREAADRDGEWILDACAGSGAVARQLAETFPAAVIVCADISGRMLCEVRRRWRPGDGKRPYLVQADATRLPFRSDIFGVVFLQNAPPYVEEMVRVGLPRAAVALIYTFGAVVPERYETLIATKCKHAGLATVQVVRTGGGAYVIGEKEAK